MEMMKIMYNFQQEDNVFGLKKTIFLRNAVLSLELVDVDAPCLTKQ